METKKIAGQTITVHRYNTVIVGAGAAGMNCAVHLCEFMADKGIADAGERIAVITGGISLAVVKK